MEKAIVLNNNALARRINSEQFFAQAEGGTPHDMIKEHEAWLKGEIESFGVPVDNRTWSHFHDNAIAGSLDQKLPYSLRTLEKRAYKSIGNILQALAWYYAPESASWNSPKIHLKPQNQVFVNNEAVIEAITRGAVKHGGWHPPMENYKSFLQGCAGIGASDKAVFCLEVNEHYEEVQGSLKFNDDFQEFRGVRAAYDHSTGILQVSFTNPNDFMGWYEIDGKLVYKLERLDEFLLQLTEAVSSNNEGAIAVDTWRAY